MNKLESAFKESNEANYTLIHKRHLAVIEGALDKALIDANAVSFAGGNIGVYKSKVLQNSVYEVEGLTDCQINNFVESTKRRYGLFVY